MWETLSKKEKLILLSGIFEGEGCCGFYIAGGKDRRNIELSVKMTDEDVILKFKEFFQKGFTGKAKIYQEHHKQAYRWKVTGVEALKIMNRMLPYLGKRRSENYYGMVQLIRDGGKDCHTHLLKQAKDKTSNV